MKITRTSMLTGRTRTFDLDITEEQIDRYNRGALIQDAFPNLSDDEREFMMTGSTAEEWDDAFGHNPWHNTILEEEDEDYE